MKHLQGKDHPEVDRTKEICNIMDEEHFDEKKYLLLQCREECEKTLFHCLKQGGKHSEVSHVNAMVDCIEVCTLVSSFLNRNSAYKKLYKICAEICNYCATSCASFEGDNHMQHCAEMCRQCALYCNQLT